MLVNFIQISDFSLSDFGKTRKRSKHYDAVRHCEFCVTKTDGCNEQVFRYILETVQQGKAFDVKLLDEDFYLGFNFHAIQEVMLDTMDSWKVSTGRTTRFRNMSGL